MEVSKGDIRSLDDSSFKLVSWGNHISCYMKTNFTLI